MITLALRIGDKYGPEYETYLNSKIDVTWIREPFSPKVLLQWNKMIGMTLDTNDPICVIDIDILLLNDYMDLFNYPIKPGQFIGIPSWWGDTEDPSYTINGGFYKYFPKDCRYIYEKFVKDPQYWQEFYIKNETTIGPVNGEQYFVEDSVKENLELITVPPSWVCRMAEEGKFEREEKYKEITGNEYMYLGDFHPDIKLAHYTHSLNKVKSDFHYI